MQASNLLAALSLGLFVAAIYAVAITFQAVVVF